MNKRTCVSYFSCGGLKTLGAVAAGFTPVGAVEINPKAAEYYALNVSPKVTVGSVHDHDPSPYVGVDLFLASPSCKNASVANVAAGETSDDYKSSEAVCLFLKVVRPPYFFLENVGQYQEFDAFRLIVQTLHVLGYNFTYAVHNAADFGVPQTRKRLIVRACLNHPVPALTATHCDPKKMAESQISLFDDAVFEDSTHGLLPWAGWYDAIEDLIPGLPDSNFASWQLKRLPADFRALLVGGANTSDVQAAPGVGVSYAEEPVRCYATNSSQWKALLVNANSSGDESGNLGIRSREEPVFTVTGESGNRTRAYLFGDSFITDSAMNTIEGRDASHEPVFTVKESAMRRPITVPKAHTGGGRVVSMSARALARFQTIPDSYVLPPKTKDAMFLVGNGVPVLFAQKIIEASFHE